MTKAELIAALRKSKAKPTDLVYIWDYGNHARHELQSVDDGGLLDLNCNNEDFDEEADSEA
jgi:hypothetical protein